MAGDSYDVEPGGGRRSTSVRWTPHTRNASGNSGVCTGRTVVRCCSLLSGLDYTGLDEAPTAIQPSGGRGPWRNTCRPRSTAIPGGSIWRCGPTESGPSRKVFRSAHPSLPHPAAVRTED